MPRHAESELIVRLADSSAEVRAAQALRYRVFYENMGAMPSDEVRRMERDFDKFDLFCDHLLILDPSLGLPRRPKVVGTYRLLRGTQAELAGSFYSDAEFDLSPLGGYPGEHLELGRSCVDPNYRNRAAMQLLWKGIADYVRSYDISLMFGCASFPGTDLHAMEQALSYLACHRLAAESWRPRARPNRHVAMDRLAADRIDLPSALRQFPPLIKGYLRLGAVVGDGAVIDGAFNTVDVCLLVETRGLPERYMQHFKPMDAKVGAEPTTPSDSGIEHEDRAA